MAVITFPTALESYVAQQAIGQRRFDTFDASDVTGAVDVVIGGPPRWTQQLQALDGMELAIAGQWDALMLQLRGGVNHLAMHDLLRPLPTGTMRRTPTLGATLAAGVNTAALTGATGVNLMFGGSFEFDGNADGLADGWSAVQVGAITSAVYARQTAAAEDGIWEQGYEANYGATGLANRVGVERTVQLPAGAGSYTLLANVRGDSELRAVIVCEWRTSLGAIISESTAVDIGVTPAVQRIGGSVVAPAGTAQVTIRLLTYRSVGTGTRAARWDVCAIKAGSVDLTWPGGATLLPGDWLQIGTGVGSHYAKVTQALVVNDAGAGSVTFEPPTRQSYPSGTAIIIEKARGHYKRANSTAGWANVPGALMSGGHALELLEQWS